GHPCYVAASIEEAWKLAAALSNPIMAGELGGYMPSGFHMNNSPAQLIRTCDHQRPVVMVSSAGTRLLGKSSSCRHVYITCLRNFEAVANHIIGRHNRIALIGAGSRGEFREEDQLCCAWVGDRLVKAGYKPENALTEQVIQMWGNTGCLICRSGKSAAYLERTGQLEDLDFIVDHVNDIRAVYRLQGRQVVCERQPHVDVEEDCAAMASHQRARQRKDTANGI
ncbi:MAG TPA: 2-phosphosulfolactate phosphatase, partial [Verrucomicrobiae bacterium]|nr:2-phosphosulfolactate phosphatase [Verrucomicrobiae bacterium]